MRFNHHHCRAIRFRLLVKDTGSDGIMSDEAKAMLWILNVQAYGQFGEIDLSKEWSRLDKAIGEPAHDNN